MDKMADEHSPLLSKRIADSSPADPERHLSSIPEESTTNANNVDEAKPKVKVYTILPVLALGVLVANIDETFVFASGPIIASDFDSLSKSGWLVSSYSLVMCAIQPLYGRFSDVFGRKTMILTSYTIFCIGCCISATGSTFTAVLAGRAIAGMGGAGMHSLSSIVVADLVPMSSIPGWRSFFALSMTTGRSIGAPVGGLFTDLIGWRWSFFIQCPLMMLAGVLVMWRLPRDLSKMKAKPDTEISKKSLLARLDLPGAVLLCGTIMMFLLTLNVAGTRKSYTIATTAGFGVATLVMGNCFVIVEKHIGNGGIFPLRIFQYREVMIAYTMAFFQYGAQYAVLFTIPPYFQVTESVSASIAGTYLLPAIIGNTIGSLGSGYLVYRTRRYRLLTVAGIGAGLAGYAAIVGRFHGNTNIAELSYTVLGAIGTAIVSTTAFMHIATGLPVGDIAVAGIGVFCSHNTGAAAAVAVSTAVLQHSLAAQLGRKLAGVDGAAEIIAKSTSNLDYVNSLTGNIRDIVVGSYVVSFTLMFGISLAMSVCAFTASLFIKEHTF